MPTAAGKKYCFFIPFQMIVIYCHKYSIATPPPHIHCAIEWYAVLIAIAIRIWLNDHDT
jgi:hypothetical protein